jgi:hypothetical protein
VNLPSGRKLLEPVLKSADFEGSSVFCTLSNRNILPFFEKFGFQIAENIKTPSKGPPFVALLRKPANPEHKTKVEITPLLIKPLNQSQSIIIEDVKIIKPIGAGNFANVYKAMWLESTPIALKVTKNPQEFEREEALLRFVLDVLFTFRSLNHPNIVKYLGVYGSDSLKSIAMEYLSKGSLSNLVSKEKAALTLVDLLGMYEAALTNVNFFQG